MIILNELDYRERSDGMVEVWTLGHYAEKGFSSVHGKYYEPTLVETIAADEAASRFQAAADKQAAAKNAADEKAAEEAAFVAYVADLPAKIAGFTRRGGELEDGYGNYVISIPKKAGREGWSVEKLSSWVDDQTAEGYGD